MFNLVVPHQIGQLIVINR
ncbi:hypothetical protein Zm00014a_042129 [Zea mays]|uniref:Uncharacterized protein n=1 Tax=Zea mays TaxID=4577 RepID=A0A317YD91_MAIZE|nr:hypothetical protein Zm00014a_042129 [Zea mays]